MEDSELKTSYRDTPQGSSLSGLWKKEDAHLIRYTANLFITVWENPEFLYIKLQNIIEDIGRSLNTEKTRLVEA